MQRRIREFTLSTILLVTGCWLGPLALAADANAELEQKLLLASPDTIRVSPELTALTNTLAETALAAHCSACHGETLEGSVGVPNLVDYEWLWGITGMEMTSVEPVHQIMQTILYGVRNTQCPDSVKKYGACPDTRFSQMPAYSTLDFSEQTLSDLTEYVIDLSGGTADADAVARAAPYLNICTECHGEEGYGNKAYGGPDLSDDIWLYGDSREQIYDVIANGRQGICPPWSETLDAASVKAIAVYLFNKSSGL